MAAYYQSACKGTSRDCITDCTACVPSDTGTTTNLPNITTPASTSCPGTPLGDLLGTWNVLGVLYRYNGEPVDYKIIKHDSSTPPLQYTNYSNTQVGIGANQINGMYNPEINENLPLPTGQLQYLLQAGDPITSAPKFAQVNLTNPTPPPNTTPYSLEDFFNFIINPQKTDIGTVRTGDTPGTLRSRRFGFMSVPIDYKKYGLRGQFFLDIACNFGLIIQGGINNITQRPTFNDLTCSAVNSDCPDIKYSDATATPPYDYKNDVRTYFTNPKKFGQLAHMLGYNLSCFNQTGFEDTMVGLICRGNRECNWDKSNPALPHLIFSPFFALQSSIPTGTLVSPRHPFAISSGNNGHWGIGGTIGCTIDFVDSIDFGFDVGVDQFFGRRYDDMPVPTNSLQTVLYPYSAELDLYPGTNWTIGLSANTYHVVEALTLYVEYRAVFHKKDNYNIISMCAPSLHTLPAVTDSSNLTTTTIPFVEPVPSTSAVLTGKMANESCWNSQMLILGMNYDITRFVHLGLGAQIPLVRCNAYRTSTLFGALGIMF